MLNFLACVLDQDITITIIRGRVSPNTIKGISHKLAELPETKLIISITVMNVMFGSQI